jgi:hypothetical protein
MKNKNEDKLKVTELILLIIGGSFLLIGFIFLIYSLILRFIN